jgi:hypothetical protein
MFQNLPYMKVYNDKTGEWEGLDLSRLEEFPGYLHPVSFKPKETDRQAREYSKDFQLTKASQPKPKGA